MTMLKSSLTSELIKHGVLDINSSAVDGLLARCSGIVSDPSVLFSEDVEFYKSRRGKVNRSTENDSDIKLLKVNLYGRGKDLFVAFYRKGRDWEGIRLGAKEALLSASTRSNTSYCTFSFLVEFHNLLLVKEKWMFKREDNFLDFYRLKLYLSSICSYARKLSDSGKSGKSVVFNKNNFKVMFSTNLLNVFGSKIVLCHSIRTIADSGGYMRRFVDPVVVGNSKDAEDNGFTAEDYLELEPMVFYSSADELVFSGKLDDFDLEDIHHMRHIKTQRRDRLPQFVNEMDDVSWFSFVKNAVDIAIRRNSVDYKWIIPSFSITDQMALFLIPVFKYNAVQPSCALLVGKRGTNKWTIFTVLSLDQAYLSARLIAPPCGWLDL
jgi:hypothetical protein